jgi:PPK2 family polyphosphate:nucleotide phosphotransferase
MDLDLSPYRIKPGTTINLTDLDPSHKVEYERKEAEAISASLQQEIGQYQKRLYAEARRSPLYVFEGFDGSGKDTSIERVFDKVNPQGLRISSFKAPSKEELAHDYLWRAHHAMPAKGTIRGWNRSHYQDVWVVRVDNLLGKKPVSFWHDRYAQITNFEALATQEGTTISKIFLLISKEEQRKQLQERFDDPEKHFKGNLDDLRKREQWDEYTALAGETISATSTDYAPWYVVPANKRWSRDLIIANIVLADLEKINPRFPEHPEYKDIIVK